MASCVRMLVCALKACASVIRAARANIARRQPRVLPTPWPFCLVHKGLDCYAAYLTWLIFNDVGIILPVAGVIACFLLTLICVLILIIGRSKRQLNDWEIDYDELEMGEHLGTGGYGRMYRSWVYPVTHSLIHCSETAMVKSTKRYGRVLRSPSRLWLRSASPRIWRGASRMKFV